MLGPVGHGGALAQYGASSAGPFLFYGLALTAREGGTMILGVAMIVVGFVWIAETVAFVWSYMKLRKERAE